MLMADQPGIAADDVRALIERFRATRKQIVRLRFADGPGPALLSREIYAEAGHLHGDVGARVLIASHPEWVEEVDDRAPGTQATSTPEPTSNERDAGGPGRTRTGLPIGSMRGSAHGRRHVAARS